MRKSIHSLIASVVLIVAIVTSCTDDGPPTSHAYRPPDPNFWLTPDTVYAEAETKVKFKLEHDDVEDFPYDVIWDNGDPWNRYSDYEHWYGHPGTYITTATIRRHHSMDTVAVVRAVAIIAPLPELVGTIKITTPRTVMYMLVPDTLEATLPTLRDSELFVRWEQGDGFSNYDQTVEVTSRQEIAYRNYGEFILKASVQHRDQKVSDSMRIIVPEPKGPVETRYIDFFLIGMFDYSDTITYTQSGVTEIRQGDDQIVSFGAAELGYYHRRPWKNDREWIIRKGIDHPTFGIRLKMSADGSMIEEGEFWATGFSIIGSRTQTSENYIRVANLPVTTRNYPHSGEVRIDGPDLARCIKEIRRTVVQTERDGTKTIRRGLTGYRFLPQNSLRISFEN